MGSEVAAEANASLDSSGAVGAGQLISDLCLRVLRVFQGTHFVLAVSMHCSWCRDRIEYFFGEPIYLLRDRFQVRGVPYTIRASESILLEG